MDAVEGCHSGCNRRSPFLLALNVGLMHKKITSTVPVAGLKWQWLCARQKGCDSSAQEWYGQFSTNWSSKPLFGSEQWVFSFYMGHFLLSSCQITASSSSSFCTLVKTSLTPWVWPAALRGALPREFTPIPNDGALGPPFGFQQEETKLLIKQRVSSNSFTARMHCEERDLHPPNEQMCSEYGTPWRVLMLSSPLANEPELAPCTRY